MGFNYGMEKRRFEAEWKRLTEEYKTAGFNEDGIKKMREYDWKRFCERRIDQNREQELPSEDFDDEGDDNACSNLFIKFVSLSCGFDESDFTSRYGWIEAIDDPLLAGKLKNLSDADKELLTLLAFDGYTQAEIAVMQGVSKVAINKKLGRIKKVLRQG